MPKDPKSKIDLEVCVNSPDRPATIRSVSAAYEGGAARVELCAGMNVGGLTPPVDHIAAARDAFGDRPGLIVMIRPHAKSFVYTPDELDEMVAGIRAAHGADADGVALGALRPDGRIDAEAMQRLVDTARSYGLATTFHRAFDATPDPLAALEDLLRLGVDRVLTAGIPWGRPGSADQGIPVLRQVIRQAGQALEVVIGGGVNRANVGSLLQQLPITEGRVSVHAYSGAQEDGETTPHAVRVLVQAANAGSTGIDVL